jgi:hypothetical protein
MDLYRTPPLLVIQLKRFQYNQVSRRKLNNLVTFPLNVSSDPFVSRVVAAQPWLMCIAARRVYRDCP